MILAGTAEERKLLVPLMLVGEITSTFLLSNKSRERSLDPANLTFSLHVLFSANTPSLHNVLYLPPLSFFLLLAACCLLTPTALYLHNSRSFIEWSPRLSHHDHYCRSFIRVPRTHISPPFTPSSQRVDT